MARVFIIGDIHGCCKTFKKLIDEKISIKKTDKIYCLGDFIDRGPDSKGVIDFIIQLRKEGFKVHTLRGNHEQFLLKSEFDEQSKEIWIRNGGHKTLASFSADSIRQLDTKYLDFFKRTKYYIETKNFILVHAGLNFASSNPLTDKEAMLWIRNFSVDSDFLNGKLLIHGHTPKHRDFILSQKFESSINLDGGCVFNQKEGYGSLFALNFYDRLFIEQKNID